jgi:O-antigen biosynthesis protein
MKVSIVIVNYNVREFLEQCLRSVFIAIDDIESEIFVVDNHSVDGSQSMVRDKFPQVNLIENKENLGFSRANNQALRQVQGEYVLILNPDTLLEEETIRKCIFFMDSHNEAGALGVKMINGKGKFLPESKRALPTPAVAFYKMFGLAKIFPNSRKFGKYHLTYLDKDKIHAVEILSGAFMFIRKEALTKAGIFDEDFFMYGEDIDLSYRITKEGYRNYYFPETTIIHYKGESTKKSSINYVLMFYKAMLVFYGKHFSKNNDSLFSLLIKLAVYFRASMAAVKRWGKIIFLPVVDFLFMMSGLILLTLFWEHLKFSGEYSYPPVLTNFILPSYILVWMVALYVAGAYNKTSDFKSVLRGVLTGTIFILLVYSLLPESLRFSRALILTGTLVSMASAVLSRITADLFKISEFYLFKKPVNRIAFIGSRAESKHLISLLNTRNHPFEFLGNIYDDEDVSGSDLLGKSEDLEEILVINRINEIIFSSHDLSISQIIDCMNKLNRKKISFKILSADGQSIVGAEPGTRDVLKVG